MKKLIHHKNIDDDLEIYLQRRKEAVLAGNARFKLPKSQQRKLRLTKRMDRRFGRRTGKQILAEFAEFCDQQGSPISREIRLS